MEEARKKIALLIKEGKRFSYENFSTKGPYGHPEDYTPAWVAWRTRSNGAIVKLFGPGSAAVDMLKAGFNVQVLGNASDKFTLAQAYFLGALEAALGALEEDKFGELRTATTAPGSLSKKVFVVHGHDDKSKAELEVFLREIGLEPVVLHRQPDEGQTIIEKFEKHSDVGYAFVILTPDEMAYLTSQEKTLDAQRVKEMRARPNVIFEFGYFVGRLGRSRVCCLHTGGTVLPSDLDGLLYKKFKVSIEEVAYAIIKELKAAGYQLTLEADDA